MKFKMQNKNERTPSSLQPVVAGTCLPETHSYGTKYYLVPSEWFLSQKYCLRDTQRNVSVVLRSLS